MLIQGIILGISLSFLVGPLLFALVEAGIGQGFRAGVSLAAGIWTSDLLYVAVAMYSIEALEALAFLPDFRLWAGLLGGLLLLAFGLRSLWRSVEHKTLSQELVFQPPEKKPYIKWWLRGFLLNAVNPGTVFFWVGITTGVMVPKGWSKQEIGIFLGGMFAALTTADVLKAWAAKRLRRFLTPAHTRQLQFGIGLLLAIFGAVLMVQSVFFKQL